MFEQSILIPDPAKKTWTFAASILVEVSAVSVLLLIPLVYTERLGAGWIQSSIMHPPPPSPPPVHQQVLQQVQPTSRTAKRWNPLVAVLTRLRNADEIMKDASRDQAVLEPCPACVVGGVPNSDSTVFNGLPGDRVPPPPQQKQPPKVEPKKPVEQAATGPIRVSLGTQEAKIIRRVIPTYPALARQARVQGTVKLIGVISTEGRIERLQVLSGHPLLVPAAVDAVKQWTYRPTLLSGQPVEVMAPIEVNFVLSN